MVTNLPDRPPYFNRSVTINLRGAPFLSDRPTLAHLGSAEFNVVKQQGVTTLDVRPAALFGDGHAAGSLNIGVATPSFSVWCGFFVNPDLPIALVVDYETEAERAQVELARIGFDHVVGFISADDLDETLQITQIGARRFSRLHGGSAAPAYCGCTNGSRVEPRSSGGRSPYPAAAAARTHRGNYPKCSSDSCLRERIPQFDRRESP